MSCFCISQVAPPGWGTRHTLAFLGFWGFAISYAMRVNLSIAIVAMVNNTKKPTEALMVYNHTYYGNVSVPVVVQYEEACVHLKAPPLSPEERDAYTDSLDSQEEFRWDLAEQGIILGSFYGGYGNMAKILFTQLPGGIIATKYGGKWTLGIGLFVSSIFTILTPMLARTHVYLLVAARVIQGLAQGVCTPTMHVILAAWAPPDERSLLYSIVFAGAQFGTAVTMVISGYLIHGGIFGGWPSAFYFVGGFSVLWFILWVMFTYDTPASHPRISPEELAYIQSSIGDAHGGTEKDGNEVGTPWLEIFTSVPMWALIVGNVGHTYGLYTILTLLPTYLKTALHFDIKENSWISALPYLAMWVAAIVVTQLADRLVAKKIFETVTVRKLCQAGGHIGSALALIGASYSGCDRALTVSLLTLAMGMSGATYGGYVVNHVDISPNYAGILMGITNTVATLTGIAAPYIAGLLLNDDPSVQNWQYVFFIAAGVYFTSVLIFIFYASAKEQSWNRPKEHEHDTSLKEVKETQMKN